MTRRPADLQISDHALLRFLERAGLCDVETLRLAMSASVARAVAAADALGSADYQVVTDGITYVVRDRVVVTILPAGRRASK